PTELLPSGSPSSLEWFLLAAVTCLGFLLASFPARNPDIWMHLANGRQLAQSGITAATTADHPSWLFDLASYGLYVAFGEEGLIIFKALLVAVLVVVLLWLSATGQGWWVPIGCTALALLAVGVSLDYGPAVLSYLFLATALLLLRPRGASGSGGAARLLRGWPMLVLFAVWANTGAWAVLGLAVVALVIVGRFLDRLLFHEPEASEFAVEAMASLVLAAVGCALTPSIGRGFALPPELACLFTASSTGNQVTWPRYFKEVGWSPAGMAYWALLALGLASSGLNSPQMRLGRLLPWAALAGLGVFQVKVVPFFAVVAVPVLA